MQFDELEIKRKLFHIISGLIIIILIDLNMVGKLFLGVILFLGIITSLISKKIKVPIFYWFLEQMDRKEDLKNRPGNGALYFIAGCLLSLILFDKDIALASIIILSIGDAIGSFVGIHFGRIKHPLNRKKLIEGTIAGIVLSFIGAVIFVNYKEALIGAILGMIVESVELKYKNFVANDNLTIPLISGLSIYLFRII